MNVIVFLPSLLPKIQRTKVESKSQHGVFNDNRNPSCYQKYKEQKLKANHNIGVSMQRFNELLPKIQRTKVESKSQL